MSPTERGAALAEVRRLTGWPVARVYARVPFAGELPGDVPGRKPHWFAVVGHPATPDGQWCGCLRWVRTQPHAASRRLGPSGVLRNPRRLNELFGRTASRPLTAADGHRLVKLLHKITNDGTDRP